MIFNAASTSHKDCEGNPSLAKQVNVDSVIRIADEFAARDSKLILISSNAVFDGSTPLAEAHLGYSPSSIYGRQKAEAEAKLGSIGCDSCIIRFSKLSHSLKPLVSSWGRSLAIGEEIEPFSDAFVAPVRTELAAKAIVSTVTHNLTGIVQLSAKKDLFIQSLQARLHSFLAFLKA